MNTLAERIKIVSAGKPRGWQAELARFCKIRPPSVADWVSGKTKTLDGENLLRAAEFFKCNPIWLATGKGKKDPEPQGFFAQQPQPEYGNVGEKVPLRGRVPVISFVAAGNWSEAVDNFAPGDSDEWISTTVPVKRHTYALRVQGDSMEPKFPNGAIIIVEPEEEAKNGSYVIVRQNGSEATFKQLIIDGGRKMLNPLNQRYPVMDMKEDAVICGVVKQMVMDV